ncbi:hypothetical protein D9M71_416570 [compost metagenome]
MLFADVLATVLAALEDGIDLLGAGLVGADLGLGPLRTGLDGDDQAVGLGQRVLLLGQLVAALIQQLFQLGKFRFAVALRDRHLRAALQSCQFPLGLAHQVRRIAQLALQIGEAFLAFLLIGDEGLRLFIERGLGLGLAIGRFAVGGCGGRLGYGGAGGRGGRQAGGSEAEAQQCGGNKGAQGSNHRDRAARGGECG